jgi:hypothetical protein
LLIIAKNTHNCQLAYLFLKYRKTKRKKGILLFKREDMFYRIFNTNLNLKNGGRIFVDNKSEEIIIEEKCQKCAGSGKLGGKTCPECGGKGTVLTEMGKMLLSYVQNGIRLSEH